MLGSALKDWLKLHSSRQAAYDEGWVAGVTMSAERIGELEKLYQGAKREAKQARDHARDLEGKLDELTARFHRIDFECRPGFDGHYRVTVDFDAFAFQYMHAGNQEASRWLAESVGRQVEREIATNRFVDKVRENRLKERLSFRWGG